MCTPDLKKAATFMCFIMDIEHCHREGWLRRKCVLMDVFLNTNTWLLLFFGLRVPQGNHFVYERVKKA